MMNDIRIFEVTEAKDTYVDAVNRLLVQLSSSSLLFTIESLEEVVASSSSHLFFAECDGSVVGMLTVGEYLAPTGRKLWIEDVVVDAECRGQSIGKSLVDSAKECAVALGAEKIYLTSNPSRKAAHALYKKCGFEEYDTTVFRIKC